MSNIYHYVLSHAKSTSSSSSSTSSSSIPHDESFLHPSIPLPFAGCKKRSLPRRKWQSRTSAEVHFSDAICHHRIRGHEGIFTYSFSIRIIQSPMFFGNILLVGFVNFFLYMPENVNKSVKLKHFTQGFWSENVQQKL